MTKIDLQNKTKCLNGTIDYHWFENQVIGLERTLFHRIVIPLAPFDSGLNYEEQPLETVISIDWLKLQLENPMELGKIQITSKQFPDVEITIYVGSAHNPCEIIRLDLEQAGPKTILVFGEFYIDFEHEGVGCNETFSFNAIIENIGDSTSPTL